MMWSSTKELHLFPNTASYTTTTSTTTAATTEDVILVPSQVQKEVQNRISYFNDTSKEFIFYSNDPVNIKWERISEFMKMRSYVGSTSDPIAPMELPGYTGYPRNGRDTRVAECKLHYMGAANAKAQKYHGDGTVVSFEPIRDGPSLSSKIHHHDIFTDGNEFLISISCPYAVPNQAQLYQPVFFTRAYGPSIIVGSQLLTDKTGKENDSITDITFHFCDVGFYTMEVILESLFLPNLKTIPVEGDNYSYEGFSLPGFPLLLHVTDSGTTLTKNTTPTTVGSGDDRMCSSVDIQNDNSSSTGRWIVRGHNYQTTLNSIVTQKDMNTHMSSQEIFKGYTEGVNRLAIVTEYKPSGCILLPSETFRGRLSLFDSCNLHVVQGIHFIFVGDSITQQHYDEFNVIVKEWESSSIVSFVNLRDGLYLRLDDVEREFQTLQQVEKPKVVVFNSAMHEIGRYCPSDWSSWRNQNGVSDHVIGKCIDNYSTVFRTLVQHVNTYFEKSLNVFRTTNAPGMRYGNFGFGWDPNSFQQMLLSPHSAKWFNVRALEIIKDFDSDIKVYDLFWMSWSRPDDTEIQSHNEPGGHMVHLGRETLNVSLRKLMTIVLDHFGCLSSTSETKV